MCVRSRSLILLLSLAALTQSHIAHAEIPLFQGDGWQVYTDGRFGAFLSWAYGDGYPQPLYGLAPDGTPTQIRQVIGGGWHWPAENQLLNDPSLPTDPSILAQGKVNQMRVRSGYAGMQLGFGFRNEISPSTRVVGYIQLWTYTETFYSDFTNPPEIRQGYADLQGAWGSFVAGRIHPLFSRGATEIVWSYAQRWSVGYPPSGITYPAPAEWYAAGLVYTTPTVAGFRLSAGVFDPIVPNVIGWVRTGFAGPQSELTFEHALGSAGRIVLFANGMVQKIYKDGYCPPPTPSSPSPCEATLAGVGYGGRIEVGRVHIGVAGHRSVGIEPDYLPEVQDAEVDAHGFLRTFDGYSIQGELALRRFDIFAGANITRVFPTETDNQRVPDPTDPTGTNQILPFSLIKYQAGINGGIVYQPARGLHFDLDYIRMRASWYQGEKQVINVTNCGMVVSW
jgi:hypothetical protein